MNIQQFTEKSDVLNLLDDLRERTKDKIFSDVIDDDGNQYVDLVMEGGGVFGIALVGYTGNVASVKQGMRVMWVTRAPLLHGRQPFPDNMLTLSGSEIATQYYISG